MLTAVRVGSLVVKFRKPILMAVIGFIGVLFLTMAGISSLQLNPPISGEIGGKANVSPAVRNWEPVVKKFAEEFGIGDYTELLLALMQQESGGTGLDPMQASEGAFNNKYPKIPNGIQDPIYSIWAGVQEFKNVLMKANYDVPLTLQSYNYGPGFIDYIKARGGKYSKELAIQFSQEHTPPQGICSSAIRTQYKACYGDFQYSEKVLKNLTPDTSNVAIAAGVQGFDVNTVYNTMANYLGKPYYWTGVSPETGFDCSGLMLYGFRQVGINLPRTAQEQYNFTAHVNPEQLQAGDLVFFQGTYNGPTVTHVGLYLGNGKMINSNDSGLRIDNVFDGYWGKHYYGAGRVIKG
ncbi:hypothetical protein BIV60_11980 [Bacillus sp. MUM 116]|uniref:bifunctional lytic transglycosylase/C40 family peptidase n=1 Tax=Bacillus sp. MUM 116 TaxID=1678002 RepID=UPI0008F591AC|nr:bifunctional lytic transglycosylase/C40 family peptidase [Bacillus sp. MUM 116]OIK14221.1 hypothetical protein BIV60_11980 [Bacillus sp. MUM 116]